MTIWDSKESCVEDVSGGINLSALALAQADFVALTVNRRGIITFVNDSFTRYTGYERHEAVGESVTLLRSSIYDDVFYAGMRARLEAGGIWSDRLTVGRKDGGHFRSRSIASPIWDSAGQIAGYSFFSRDTADEARMEAQLGHLQKMEAIGEMAAGIAHEINTPIQYIGDNIQFLREATEGMMRLAEALSAACEAGRAGPISADVLEGLAALREAIDWDFLNEEIPLAIEQALEGRDRVAAIVRAMKEFAHPGDDEQTPVDVNRAIENTLAVSRGEWKHVADVSLDLAEELPPVPCLPGLFNQVLLNLVVNASHAITDSKARRDGAPGLIHISSGRRDGAVEIVIGDNGGGIPPEILTRIFDPFFTTKDVGKGTGQGLALAHAVVVERMKGRIDVDSRPGEGARFILTLPLEDLDNAANDETND